MPSLRLAKIRHLALDLDGTVYSGGTVFPSSHELFRCCLDLEIAWSFVTNNSSRSVDGYVAELSAMGLPTRPDQILISTHSAIDHLREERPELKTLFVLGTRAMMNEFESAGFGIHDVDDSARPDAVVVGFDPRLEYDRLCRAAYFLRQGAAFIATHPDRVCPTDEPTVLVDCGSICACLEAATGRKPNAVLGKPNPGMLSSLMTRHGLATEELAMAGDRLYTDIAMARKLGVFSILVLTGESTAEDAEASEWSPDLICADLGDLSQRLRQSRATGSSKE